MNRCANPTGRPITPRSLPHPEIMAAIAASPGAHDGVPIDLTSLRKKFPQLSKAGFDRAILRLADERLIYLTTHDHGPALPASRQADLVSDPKTKGHGRPSLYVAAQLRNPEPAVTDRALRYRAHHNPPPGPKTCHYCGSKRSIDLEHIDGREENNEPANLMYACRSCNTRKGARFARLLLGRKTRQYNPRSAARNLREWMQAAQTAVAAPTAAAARAAVATIQATAPEVRARFAAELAARRKNPDPTFEQYLFAVRTHERKAHDEGGKIIHATSQAKRSEYANKIASLKQQRGTNRRKEEVPF